MVGVLWHHESAARGYYTRAPRSAQNLIHRARENTHMHDFSCSGAESVVSLSYFSPAQPAGPTIIKCCNACMYVQSNDIKLCRWSLVLSAGALVLAVSLAAPLPLPATHAVPADPSARISPHRLTLVRLTHTLETTRLTSYGLRGDSTTAAAAVAIGTARGAATTRRAAAAAPAATIIAVVVLLRALGAATAAALARCVVLRTAHRASLANHSQVLKGLEFYSCKSKAGLRCVILGSVSTGRWGDV